jgi:hypothetical protein
MTPPDLPKEKPMHRLLRYDSDILFQQSLAATEAMGNKVTTLHGFAAALTNHCAAFYEPLTTFVDTFLRVEEEKIFRTPPWETLRDYVEFAMFRSRLSKDEMLGTLTHMNRFLLEELNRGGSAVLDAVFGGSWERIANLSSRKASLMNRVLFDFPKAIRDIKPEFGFHLESEGYEKVAETDRFDLYRVLPSEPGVEMDPNGKPILMIPPYVLGENILCFLPGEHRSFVHAYANQGIPTYVRIVKDIQQNEAVQEMSGEDDALDIRNFCEAIRGMHGRAVHLLGFCQGGFLGTLALLSGELDGLVDAYTTCVAPIDGTRSKALKKYLETVPSRFRDLAYSGKTLPNGNVVVDGKVLGWVYKFMSVAEEAPAVAFFKEMEMLRGTAEEAEPKISRIAAAINHWLLYDRVDIPMEITRLSHASYTVPIAGDGTMPVTLFGKELNIRRIEEAGIPWLICACEADAVVDPPAALAPLDWVKAEVTMFPKGHSSIATSWSVPTSKYALHKNFGKYRGPVRFHLDLQGAT